jgi:2-methylisocitrate lyase-like PEP mutase family enzyme
MPAPDQVAARRKKYRNLHERGCFVVANAWDVGSARYLEHLGFEAVATTSGGFAFSLGLPDVEEAVTRDTMLAHVGEIVGAIDLPVNADFQSGYADAPESVGENVRRCVETGVAGVSIEDLSGDPRRPLYELPLAVARIEAARAAIDDGGAGVVLTARAEPYVARVANPLEEAIRRLQAYAEVGADVLYTPGPQDLDSIRVIVQAVAPKPVNVLISTAVDFTVADLAEVGVRRISVGSGLARTAWGGFDGAARGLLRGSFAGFASAMPSREINRVFKDLLDARSAQR